MKTNDIKKVAAAWAEIQEAQKAALAKKLAKASASSEKGKAAVTLPKAPWDKKEEANEALKGDQHKLDHDKDGDIDADDFKGLRNKKKKNAKEVVDTKPEIKDNTKDTEVSEISMDTAKSAYYKRKSQAQGAAAQGSMDFAKKQMAKARKTKAYIDKRESVEEATMDTAAGRKQASAEADAHHKAMVKKWGANHPATKDAANAAKVMKQKAMGESMESKRPIFDRIMEKAGNRADHVKGATPPEPMDSKASGMEKDFVAKHGGLDGNDSGIDGAKAAADTAKAAAAQVKAAPARSGDNKNGDTKPIKSTEA